MHCPWDYVDYIYDLVTDGRVTKESIIRRLKEGHPYAYKVYELAKEKEIPIFHAFSDIQDHGIPYLKITSPSTSFYFDQLINFRSITEITEDTEKKTSFFESAMEVAKKAVNWIAETWDDEKLVDPEENATSSENNSSTVLLFDFEGKKHLYTSDAGVPALEESAYYIQQQGLTLQDFSFVQIPHHGSKRNVGPTILNKLIGAPVLQETGTKFKVFISASKDGNPKHPSKRIVNALIRRGGNVIATQGLTKCSHSSGVPDRKWVNATPLPFYTNVEEDDD